MPNQFFSPEGDLENYFVTEYWLIDQYVGDELWTWGRTVSGRLGNSSISNPVSTPITTFSGGTNWKFVSSSGYGSAAIKTDGTLWMWGSGRNGVVGNATTNLTISTPVTTFAGGNNWKQVSCSDNITAAVKTDGTLWLWGNGQLGRLGNAVTTGSISTPVTTFLGGTNWKQVSCSSNNTIAIKTDGTLWTWGSNTNGQLGNASTVNTSTPVTTFLGGNDWKQVSGGDFHVAAIKTDGTLWLWGYNKQGQLGNNIVTISATSTPVTTFLGGTNWKQVSGGPGNTAAIKTDGTLWTWGYNSKAALGNASTVDISTPVTTFLGGTNWKQVSFNPSSLTFSASAIKTDGTLWLWGSTEFGSLGNSQSPPTPINISTPVTTFSGGTNWKQVSSGGDSVAAIKSGLNAEVV